MSGMNPRTDIQTVFFWNYLLCRIFCRPAAIRLTMVLGQEGYPGHWIGEWIICQNRMPLLMPRAKGGISHAECVGMDCPVPGQAYHVCTSQGINHPPAGPGTWEHIFLIRRVNERSPGDQESSRPEYLPHPWNSHEAGVSRLAARPSQRSGICRAMYHAWIAIIA